MATSKRRPAQRSRREGFADHEIRIGCGADLRYFGQAWEVRGRSCQRGRRRAKRGRRRRSASTGARAALRLQLSKRDEPGRRAGTRVGQPAGHGHRSDRRGPSCASCRRAMATGRARPDRAAARVIFDGEAARVPTCTSARASQPGDTLNGPAIIEEFGVDHGRLSRSTRRGGSLRQSDLTRSTVARRGVNTVEPAIDPIVLRDRRGHARLG